MITKKTFKCFNCGECCKPIVILSSEDIAKIEKAGFERSQFVEIHPYDPRLNVLKRNSNGCTFLRWNEKGESFCSIYEHRPLICEKYPFFDNKPLVDCLPKKSLYEKCLIDVKQIIDRRGFF